MTDVPEYKINRQHRVLTGASVLINSISPFHGGVYTVIDKDGVVCWVEDGLIHRVGGPAKIWPDGSKAWLERGLLHHMNGPALLLLNQNRIEWWIAGEWIHTFPFFQLLTKCADEDIIFLKLKYGEIQ